MGRREDLLLTKTIGYMLEKVGFKVALNSQKYGFDTDVIATSERHTMLIACRHYNNPRTNIESLLHEWNSKGKSADAHRVIVVVSGIEVDKKFFDVAKKLGVILWDDNIVHSFDKIEVKDSLREQMNKHLLLEVEYVREAKPKRKSFVVRLFIAIILYIFSLFVSLGIQLALKTQILVTLIVSFVLFIVLLVLKEYFFPSRVI